VAAKQKGKEPIIAQSKRKRALILQDEEDEDDVAISARALRNLWRFVPEIEDREDQEETE